MRNPVLACLVLSTALALPAARAQQAPDLSWLAVDPSLLVAGGEDLVRRAPPEAIDALLQAITASARDPGEAEAVCALFDPGADRGLDALNGAAGRLPPRSRDRLVTAVAGLMLGALQAPPQPWDEGAARQALKQAGVRAALTRDGFMAGLQGRDHQARCRSVGTLLEVLAARPLEERVGVARLLMFEGLAQLHAQVAADPPGRGGAAGS